MGVRQPFGERGSINCLSSRLGVEDISIAVFRADWLVIRSLFKVGVSGR